MLNKNVGQLCSSTATLLGGMLASIIASGTSWAATITTFDVPGALLTYPASINDDGTITGSYEEDSTSHPIYGFNRAPAGTITTFRSEEQTSELQSHSFIS